jgi:hypothetical protein
MKVDFNQFKTLWKKLIQEKRSFRVIKSLMYKRIANLQLDAQHPIRSVMYCSDNL